MADYVELLPSGVLEQDEDEVSCTWGEVECVPSDVLAQDGEQVSWTWADGRTDVLPGRLDEDDLPGEEVASIGTGDDMSGVLVSRLHRIGKDVWLTASGTSEEAPDEVSICRSSTVMPVLKVWLPNAADNLGHYADLTAFAAARLADLVPDGVDAAVVEELGVAVREVEAGRPDREIGQWMGTQPFLSLSSELGTLDELRDLLLSLSEPVRRAFEGDEVVRAVLAARLQAWEDL